MMFWILLTVLAVLSAWFVVLPTLRARPSEDKTRQALNTRIFKQRMAELEGDYQSGRTDQEDYDALKTELERNFLADMEKAEAEALQAGQSSKGALFLVLLLVPVLALGVYKVTGYDESVSQWRDVQKTVNPFIDRMLTGELDPSELQNIPMADFVYTLQRRAQKQQDLAQLWYVLGNTYLQIQTGNPHEQMSMLDNATQALRRAHYLEEGNVEYALSYTQALLSQNQGQLDIETRKILREVLTQQPNNPSAIMMLAMASYQSGEYQAAINGWQYLLSMGGNHDGHQKAQAILENSIRQAKRKLEEEQAPHAQSGLLQVVVNLDEPVIGGGLMKGYLMVYAQAESGPPMPLAIKKLQLPQQFPVSVSLSDADAMMPAMKVSMFETVKVTARLSETGQAMPQSGDWFGASKGVSTRANDAPVVIRISERIQ